MAERKQEQPSGIYMIEEPFIVHYNECLIAILHRYADAMTASGLEPEVYLKAYGKDIAEDTLAVERKFTAMLAFDDTSVASLFLRQLMNIRILKLGAFIDDTKNGVFVRGHN